MCTGLSYTNDTFYFGRNLDLEYALNNKVVVTPRNYRFKLRKEEDLTSHYSLIGMAMVVDNYPLYFDAVNEKGLGMGGLNFDGFSVYHDEQKDKKNITPFEFIPYLLGKCATVQEAKTLLKDINLINISFSDKLQLSPLHWLISDKDSSIVVESTSEGLQVYDNQFGVLTNNPSFPYHKYNMSNYLNLTPNIPENRLSSKVDLDVYSRGMGAIGLPGDLSSSSRFVRAAYARLNSVADKKENANISQFFHILDFVAQPRGSSMAQEGIYEITQYSSCVSTETQTYYYKTYENSQICAVSMKGLPLDSDDLFVYELEKDQSINYTN